MLEPAMRRSRIDEIRQRELMNVPKTLKRSRGDGRNLVGRDADEVESDPEISC